MDSELERFKNIDLRAYAAGQGYQLDRKDSWRGSAVMRHPDGDKIVIKRAEDGHYLYFSVRSDEDNGSIIDFCQNRQRLSLGAVRKELRQWVGLPAVAVSAFPALPKTTKDRLGMEAEFARMDDATRHPYLEIRRAIPPGLLGHDRFAGRIRRDDRGNAVFPHFDQDGLSGYEIKNEGFTGFSRGGSKGLWFSHARPDDNRLVLCESAIDALSYAALFADDRARYVSIDGKPNPLQPELIRRAIARMPAKSEIVAAMDADEDGRKLAAVVRHAVELSGRSDLRFVVHEPAGVKDWNDQLRVKSDSLLPTARFVGVQLRP